TNSAKILGRMGSNVLFVLRQDSYRILRALSTKVSTQNSLFEDNRNVFTLDNSNIRYSAIVSRRARLLLYCLNAILIKNFTEARFAGLRDHGQAASLSGIEGTLERNLTILRSALSAPTNRQSHLIGSIILAGGLAHRLSSDENDPRL